MLCCACPTKGILRSGNEDTKEKDNNGTRITIDLDPDVSEFEADPEGQLQKMRVRSGKREKGVKPVPDPVTKNTKAKAALDRAIAIVKGIDLAKGGGKIDDEDDDGSWEGVAPSRHENRMYPVVCNTKGRTEFAPAKDGFVSYGRPYFPDDSCLEVIETPPINGVAVTVSKTAGSSEPQPDTGSSSSSPGLNAAAARVLPTDVVKLWLMDTGCGHDLVSEGEISGHRPELRLANKPMVFNTAGGMAPASRVVDVKVKELNQAVTPFVLKSTPAVLSIGKRCAEQDFFFLWPAGGVPFFVRPDGKVIGLDVIGHIPYVRSGADRCRARPAKEVDKQSIESLLTRLGARASAAAVVINDISIGAPGEAESGREPVLGPEMP